MANALREFINEETGVRSAVYANTSRLGGFNVVVQDLDSGEYLPMALNYPTIERAEAKARQVAA